ncbi:response regulator [Rhizobium sp. LjRoot98]|uniref:response regulator n=1 Tax=Rhizobium sp. LjRoot98 TaxID=3342345 RepID=UPI003F50100D
MAVDRIFFQALSREMTTVLESLQVDTILVVEDEPFIAIDIEATLKDAGYAVEVHSLKAHAMGWLTVRSPSVAVLDVHLRDGEGTAIATILQARHIPVIFCSGGHPADLPTDFRAAAWVRKPFIEGELVRAVKHCRLGVLLARLRSDERDHLVAVFDQNRLACDVVNDGG